MKPERKSFAYRIYVDIVCGLKQFRGRRNVIRETAERRKIPRRLVIRVFNQYIRPQLAAGTLPQHLW